MSTFAINPAAAFLVTVGFVGALLALTLRLLSTGEDMP
jgi:hypothetical protein